jgi:predicted flap endonuclease-1-like 5' DNA nuclease
MTGGLRVRALLDRQFEIVVLVLVVLAAVGGFLAYGAYGQPNTTTETNEVTVWAPNGTFTHGSTVTDNESKLAGVFDPGQSVANRSVYYTNIMPELSGEFAFQYAAESGELDATIERTLVIRSVGQSRDEGQVEYWRQTEPLGTGSATLSPGEGASVPYDVNVSGAIAGADRVHERLGDPGQTRVSVNVTVALSGTAGGEEIDRTLEYALPLSVEGSVYRVGSVAQVEAVTRTERVTVTREPGALGAIGGPVLLGLALLGLAGLVYARSEDRLALTEAERAWLAYRDDRSDFDDWISTIRLPEDARSLPVAEADTLADLVDFAIDTDNSVLEQPGGGTYHVVHDGYRYTFEAPPDPTRAAAAAGPESGGDADPEVDASPAPHPIPDPDIDLGGGSEDPTTSSGAGGGRESGSGADLRSLRGVGPTYAERLHEAGVECPADLLEADPDRIASAADMPREGVETLVDRARELVGEPERRPDADD